MLTLRHAISRDAAVGRLRMDGVELVLDARISCSLRCPEVAIAPLQRRWRPWPFPSPAMMRSSGSRGLDVGSASSPCTSWKTSLKVPHFSSADSLQDSAPSFPLWPSLQASRMWTGQPTSPPAKLTIKLNEPRCTVRKS